MLAFGWLVMIERYGAVTFALENNIRVGKNMRFLIAISLNARLNRCYTSRLET